MRFAANNKKQRQVNKNKNKTKKQPAKPVSGKIIEFSRICNVLFFFRTFKNNDMQFGCLYV